MVAVLELIQSRGGCLQDPMASPISWVVSTLESRMALLLLSLYRQSTDLPARLMTTSAPSKALTRPSLSLQRTSLLFLEMMITISPLALNLEARYFPRKPVPPARTTFFIR